HDDLREAVGVEIERARDRAAEAADADHRAGGRRRDAAGAPVEDVDTAGLGALAGRGHDQIAVAVAVDVARARGGRAEARSAGWRLEGDPASPALGDAAGAAEVDPHPLGARAADGELREAVAVEIARAR